MNAPKFTPGPWKAVPSEGCSLAGSIDIIHRGPGEWGTVFIATVQPSKFMFKGWRGPEDAEADARAVAAVPSLIAACRGALELLTTGKCDRDGVRAHLRAALAEVDGARRKP